MNEQRRSNGMSSHQEYSQITPESTVNVRVEYNLGPSVPFVFCEGTSMALHPGLISWKFSRVQSTRSMQAIASIDTPTYTDHPTEILRTIILADTHSFELSKSAPVHLFIFRSADQLVRIRRTVVANREYAYQKPHIDM